jgi:hypothetical protein
VEYTTLIEPGKSKRGVIRDDDPHVCTRRVKGVFCSGALKMRLFVFIPGTSDIFIPAHFRYRHFSGVRIREQNALAGTGCPKGKPAFLRCGPVVSRRGRLATPTSLQVQEKCDSSP